MTREPIQPGGDERAEPIRVELSEMRLRSGDTIPVASCRRATVKSTTSPICKLARELVALGIDPGTHLSIWRGETKCFHDVPISRWAGLTVSEGEHGPVFRRYKPFCGVTVPSHSAKSDSPHTQRPKLRNAPQREKISGRAA